MTSASDSSSSSTSAIGQHHNNNNNTHPPNETSASVRQQDPNSLFTRFKSIIFGEDSSPVETRSTSTTTLHDKSTHTSDTATINNNSNGRNSAASSMDSNGAIDSMVSSPNRNPNAAETNLWHWVLPIGATVSLVMGSYLIYQYYSSSRRRNGKKSTKEANSAFRISIASQHGEEASCWNPRNNEITNTGGGQKVKSSSTMGTESSSQDHQSISLILNNNHSRKSTMLTLSRKFFPDSPSVISSKNCSIFLPKYQLELLYVDNVDEMTEYQQERLSIYRMGMKHVEIAKRESSSRVRVHVWYPDAEETVSQFVNQKQDDEEHDAEESVVFSSVSFPKTEQSGDDDDDDGANGTVQGVVQDLIDRNEFVLV